jgi:hypothetical protein
MALIEIHADMKRVADALERIADMGEALYAFFLNPSMARRRDAGPIVPAPVESLGQNDDETLWQIEQEDERRKMNGYPTEPIS